MRKFSDSRERWNNKSNINEVMVPVQYVPPSGSPASQPPTYMIKPGEMKERGMLN